MADSSNFIIPELLADATKIALAKRPVLVNSSAIIRNPTLPTTARGGSKIKIPYLGAVGEAENPAEGIALTPESPTPDSEEATVIRVGKAVTLTKWAELQAAFQDPYAALAEQLADRIVRNQEQKLVDAITAAIAPMTYTVPSSGTIDYDAVVNAKKKFGDEQDPIALMVMHSKVWFDILLSKDSTGRPLAVENVNADGTVLRVFAGCPVAVTDFMPVSSGTYTTALLKAGSCLLWEQAAPRMAEVEEPLKDQRVMAVNAYYVPARYKYMPGRSKGGVALIASK